MTEFNMVFSQYYKRIDDKNGFVNYYMKNRDKILHINVSNKDDCVVNFLNKMSVDRFGESEELQIITKDEFHSVFRTCIDNFILFEDIIFSYKIL